MAIKEIVKWDDPVLKQKCEEVTLKEFKKIRRDMEDTLRSTDIGVGLAAPQIGIAKRVILVRMDGGAPMAFANPEIIETGEEMDAYYEGCLSFPDHYVEISRPTRVTVEYMNRKGKRVKLKIREFPAKVFQHEMDHLNGICLVGDAWREGRTISGEQVQELEEQKKASKKKPAMAALGAAAALAFAQPALDHEDRKTAALLEDLGKDHPRGLDPNKCSRTACPNEGDGFWHRDLTKAHPDDYNNYCKYCAETINEVNDEELILPPSESRKTFIERSPDGGDPGRSEEATV